MVLYLFGEHEDIIATVTEREGVTCTLDSATVTIKSVAGIVIRDDVACSVDDTTSPKEAWYHETFSTANGYVEDTEYVATFKTTLTRIGADYIPKPVVNFKVVAADDE